MRWRQTWLSVPLSLSCLVCSLLVCAGCGDDSVLDAPLDTAVTYPPPATCQECSASSDCEPNEVCAPAHGRNLCLPRCRAGACPEGFACSLEGSDELCVPEAACCFDGDGDGFGVGECPQLDCDDNFASVYPGAPERCNSVDDNCDGVTDELPTTCASGDCVAVNEGGQVRYERVRHADCVAGVCAEGERESCGAYACAGPICARECAGDEDCADGFVCALDGDGDGGGECVAPCTRVGEACVVPGPAGEESCERGTYTCEAGRDVCTPSGEPRDAETLCRAARGPCDLDEVCDGESLGCPADILAEGTVCRAAEDICDVAELCDGVSPDCPGDAVESDGTVCRDLMGECDVADLCDGVSKACPNQHRPDESECSSGLCEGGSCDGSCPLAGTSCSLPGRPCERAEYRCVEGEDVCTGLGTGANGGTVCRESAGACDVAEQCDGVSPTCPSNSFQPSSHVCRDSGGACDVVERCTGSSASCPGNSFQPSSHVCRDSAGACDVEERCTGSSAGCPSNSFQPSSHVCRDSAGACDIEERCTGSSAGCPSNGFQPSSHVCRDSAGVCDIEERCTGSSAGCPSNGFRSSSHTCRGATSCMQAAQCSGSSASCPSSAAKPNGTVCGLETCTEGECVGFGTCSGNRFTTCETPICQGGSCSGVDTQMTSEPCSQPAGSDCSNCGGLGCSPPTMNLYICEGSCTASGHCCE